jgi:hypothetical protein
MFIPGSSDTITDLFDNPVGYLTSLAISRPNATLWGCEIAFLAEVV